MNNEATPEFELKIPVHWIVKWVSLFGIPFCLWLAFLMQLNHEGIGYVAFFITLSFLEFLTFLLSLSVIHVTPKSIVTTLLFNTYKMNWDEVTRIETNGGIIAFFGDDKCFPIQFGMAGKEKKQFSAFLELFIEERQLEVKPLSALWIWHKNTKVGKSNQ